MQINSTSRVNNTHTQEKPERIFSIIKIYTIKNFSFLFFFKFSVL